MEDLNVMAKFCIRIFIFFKGRTPKAQQKIKLEPGAGGSHL
jgi:hypothetical protein